MEEIIRLIEEYPEFRAVYEEDCEICLNMPDKEIIPRVCGRYQLSGDQVKKYFETMF